MTRREPRTLQEAISYFSSDANCHDAIVAVRWPDGVVRCPWCRSQRVTFLRAVRRWKCYGLHPKPQFSLKSGTVFEDSALPLQKWLPALWVLTNRKAGISSYELARALDVTQKTAWFMLHRLRIALQKGEALAKPRDFRVSRHVRWQYGADAPHRSIAADRHKRMQRHR